MSLCGLVQFYITIFFKLHNTIWALINYIFNYQFVYSARCSFRYILHLILTITYSNAQEYGRAKGTVGMTKKLRDEVEA
jgi:hypothetical protein